MTTLQRKARIMDAHRMRRAITRIAYEIVERNKGTEALAVIGIRTRGVPLGERLVAQIAAHEGEAPPFGFLDITLYRDDLQTIAYHPVVGPTSIPFDINDRHIILVDDVLFTGRTARAAISVLIDFGRPRSIHLAALIDRGHRELPICPDYVGRVVPTARTEAIQVNLMETDGEDGVYVCDLPPLAEPQS
jgi:pyrimidine operon attenuation protein/uracil phosphoribosyltransferase